MGNLDKIEIENEVNKIEEITVDYDDFSRLKFGDIIWAKRYSGADDMLDIPNGHREGPYIVIGKDGDNLKCLYGSSITRYGNKYRTLVLDDPIYSFDKITYINTSNYVILTKDRFTRKLSYLTEDDKKKLYKKISTALECGLYSGIEIPNIPLESGDVILNEYDLYLIINEDDESFYALKLLEENNGINGYVELSGKRYYLDFDNIKQFSKIEELKRNNFVDECTLNRILALQNQRLESFKHKIEVSRGSLVIRNGVYYYIYGEIGNEWMAFSLSEKSNKDWCRLIIGNRCFYTNFTNDIHFSKKDEGTKFIGMASEKEIDIIKKRKKSYGKKETVKNKVSSSIPKLTKSEIQVGSVVEVYENRVPTLYIVILRNEKEIVGIKYSGYKNGNYILNKFSVGRSKKIGNVENFDLKKVLYDIKDIANNYINENTFKRLIKKNED